MQTVTENILDVTLLEPRQKHPTIFARFDALNEGESLVIHNDHDPKPLYYQLLGERGNIFTWEYLENGPMLWRIKISKRVMGETEMTIGQLAVEDLRKAEVFKKYGIDFCCGGRKTLKEVCKEKGLDLAKIEQELLNADKAPAGRPLPYNDWSSDFLADYIVNNHHNYCRKTLPELIGYATKVASVHGGRHPELLKIRNLVNDINAELISHMEKEERVLFPYIKELVKADKNTEIPQAAHFGTVQNPINMMEMEHEQVGQDMEEIRELSNNFALPEDACASYTLLFKMLEEFESDLHIHIHLENNILFPKALEIENRLN